MESQLKIWRFADFLNKIKNRKIVAVCFLLGGWEKFQISPRFHYEVSYCICINKLKNCKKSIRYTHVPLAPDVQLRRCWCPTWRWRSSAATVSLRSTSSGEQSRELPDESNSETFHLFPTTTDGLTETDLFRLPVDN